MLDPVARLTCAKRSLDNAINAFAEAQHREMLALESPKVRIASGAEQLKVSAGQANVNGHSPVSEGPDPAQAHLKIAENQAKAGWDSYKLAMAHMQKFLEEAQAMRKAMAEAGETREAAAAGK